MNTPDIVYLDYAAATPLDASVLAAMQPYFTEKFYNLSSPYAPAVAVRREYEAAKDRLAHTFGARGNELVMTAGATESINLAFHAAANGHIVTSAAEHASVLAAAKQQGSSVTYLSPNSHGSIVPEQVAAALTDKTTLVSIQLANHELGTIQPLRAIAEAINQAREKRAAVGNKTPLLFHSDASQGFGGVDVHVARLGVDLLTLNAGKIYGPKQVGLLWARPTVSLTPLIVGGGQEGGLRSGTENVAGTIGFALAAEKATKAKSDVVALRDTLQAALQNAFPQAVVSGHSKKRLENFLHISFPGIDAERVIFMLENKGIFVATGSACAASKQTKSTVLEAIGMDDETARGSLRLTLGRATTEADITYASKTIIDTIAQEYQRLGHTS